MRISSIAIGAILSLLTMFLFAFYRMIGYRKQPNSGFILWKRLDCVGFGFLPAVAIWKVFEQETETGKGIRLFEPIPEIPFITVEGHFSVSRIEMILAVLCFISVVIWLAARKKELPGTGELIMTVVSVWGMIRAMTETLRQTPFLYAGNVNLTQILMLIAADIVLAIWTVRIGEAEKSTAFAVLEWIACLSCQGILVLNSAGILSAGSKISNLAVNTGCMLLSLILILSVGKESRN